jgi:hypothetical protein
MVVSIGHKLRAFKESLYPNSLSFRVIAPALTVDQVNEYGLPSTPLKETELRAEGWKERYGVEQTEIDALATLRPDVLTAIARDALDPFFDHTLASRHYQAEIEWQRHAQRRFEEIVGAERVSELWAIAADARANLEASVANLRNLADEFDDALPAFVRPRGDVSGDGPVLVSSDMPLAEHISILRDRKDYKAAA